MFRFHFLLVACGCMIVLASGASAQSSRLLGAGGLVIDDGNTHTITLLAPSGLDGNYTYTLPQSPGGNIMSGYVQAGTALGQVLYWNGSYWQPSVTGTSGQVLTLDGSGIPTWITGGGGGGIAGSGTLGSIPIWTSATSQGNSAIADDGSTVSVTNGEALLFSGTTGTTPASGGGTRMEWIPAKA